MSVIIVECDVGLLVAPPSVHAFLQMLRGVYYLLDRRNNGNDGFYGPSSSSREYRCQELALSRSNTESTNCRGRIDRIFTGILVVE